MKKVLLKKILHRCWLVCGVIIILFFTYIISRSVVQILAYPYEHRDWGEFDNMLLSSRLAEGEPIYTTSDWDHATSLPYTPFYHLLCTQFHHLYGPSLFIGRFISFLAYIGLGIIVWLLLRKRYKLPVHWSLLGPLLVLLSQVMTYHTFIKYHPNTLSGFLGLSAILVAPQKQSSLYRWAPSLLLGLLAAYTKQPAGLFLFGIMLSGFRIEKGRFLLPFIATLIVGFGVAYIINALTNGGFFFYCLEIPPMVYGFSLYRLFRGVIFLSFFSIPFVAPSIIYMVKTKPKQWDTFIYVVPFAIIVYLVAFSQNGGTRSSLSHLYIILSVTAPLGMYYSLGNRKDERYSFLVFIIALFFIFSSIVWKPQWDYPKIATWPHITRQHRINARHIEHRFKECEGEVLAFSNRLQAVRAGKTCFTSSQFSYHLNKMGIRRFPEIEKKLSDTTFRLVLLPLEDYRYSLETGDSISHFWSLLYKNYTITDTIDAGNGNHPALFLTPKQ